MIGISIYPEHAGTQEIKDYIKLASSYGFKRIFTCLLSVTKDKEEVIEEFKEIIDYAHEYDFHVILDISPAVFDTLGISYDDLSFFKEMGADGIRLDEGFGGSKESSLSFNPQNLDIEINMSQDVFYLDNIFSYKPNGKKLIGSHNFYPQKYTGLGYDYFIKCSERFKKYNMNTSAFVNSQSAKIGPWPVMEGLCTLEEHRNLPISTQVKHLFASGLIDDVIIANMFAAEEELKAVSIASHDILTLDIIASELNSEIENKILFEEEHFNRGDVNEYMIRSTLSRVKYKVEDFKIHDNPNLLNRGDVIIGNDNFGQYKGELQVITKQIEDPECRRNVVGKIREEDIMLLDFISPWKHFRFNPLRR